MEITVDGISTDIEPIAEGTYMAKIKAARPWSKTYEDAESDTPVERNYFSVVFEITDGEYEGEEVTHLHYLNTRREKNAFYNYISKTLGGEWTDDSFSLDPDAEFMISIVHKAMRDGAIVESISKVARI